MASMTNNIEELQKSFIPCEGDTSYVRAIRETNTLTRRILTGNEGPIQLPVEITPHLYLSDLIHVMLHRKMIQSLGITHVLNMAKGECDSGRQEYADMGIETLEIEAEDEDGYEILSSHFSEAYAFIESARLSGGKCVIHCVAGVNRSGVTAAAYMMIQQRRNILDVVSHCRQQRGKGFLRNQSFQKELVDMARTEGLLGPAPGEEGCCVNLKVLEDGTDYYYYCGKE